MDRRRFIWQTGLVTAGFLGLSKLALAGRDKVGTTRYGFYRYGPLKRDPKGIFDLPEGFGYDIISRRGDAMTDGLIVPGKSDGMAAFPSSDPNRTIVVRNHELTPDLYAEEGAFGAENELVSKLEPAEFYEFGKGELPGIGGTTTFVYDHSTGEIVTQYLSLAGTVRNCAGGLTPWGSWITCEEDVTLAGGYNGRMEKKHGYVFEVPVSEDPMRAEPVPLKDMGRFNHEAVCVDEATGIIYLTEDRHDGLFYRFLPNEKGNLRAGGRLQALMLQGEPSADTRNWDESGRTTTIGEPMLAVWVDLDQVDDDDDTLRMRGHERGAALFARGEGVWMDTDERAVYFACTNGGDIRKGQIFRYMLSDVEGQADEASSPGRIELFIEPNDIDLLQNADNLTIAPWGDVVFCEDTQTPRIVGVTPEGELYPIAQNVRFPSELTGVCFSPNGKTLFVNIQHAGLTLAVNGPWDQARG